MIQAWLLPLLLLGSSAMAANGVYEEVQAFTPTYLEPTLTDATEFKILGKGVRNGRSDQSVALACVADDCSSLRFLFFYRPGLTYFIGPLYQASDANSQEIVRKVLSTVQHKSYGRGGLVLGGSLLGGAALIPLTGGVSMLVGLGVAAIVQLSPNQSKAVQGIDVIGGYKNLFTGKDNSEAKVFRDQNGWNWSSSPKKKNSEFFRELLCSINQYQQLDMNDFRNGHGTEIIVCEGH